MYEEYTNKQKVDKDYVNMPLDELVEHIINNHHAYLNVNLPLISDLVSKILRAHGEIHPELYEVYRLFNSLKMELEAHLIKEETVQYPAIYLFLKTRLNSDLTKAVNIIKELQDEHTNAGDALKKLRAITVDFFVPSDVCNTFKVAYYKLIELESDIFQHIHLENNILFPRLFALQ